MRSSASGSVHWCTPLPIVERVRAALGVIGLDPCSNPASVVGARTAWEASHGQLTFTESWLNHLTWYANVPFGAGIEPWAAKLAREGAEILDRPLDAAVGGIGMVPANTGSGWFRDYISTASEILFWSPRVQFVGPVTGSSNNQDVASPYWGQNPRAFRTAFEGCGWFRGGR